MNAYHQILGLPQSETAPDHYGLLGVPRFCDDQSLIHAALVTRSTQLRSWDNSKLFREANMLLDEVIAAAAILEDPAKKAAYDAGLRGDAEGVTEAEILGWLGPLEHMPHKRGVQQPLPDALGTKQTTLEILGVPSHILKLMPAAVAHKFAVLPLASIDNCLRVAMSNVQDDKLLAELRYILKCDIEPVLVEQEVIRMGLFYHYGNAKIALNSDFLALLGYLVGVLIIAIMAYYADYIAAFALWVAQLLLGLLCWGAILLFIFTPATKGRR